MNVKVTHVFVRFPHPYQPYNTLLIDRLRDNEVNCHVFSFYGEGHPGKSNLSTLLFHILSGIRRAKWAFSFKSLTGKSLFQALLYVGQWRPLIGHRDSVFHIHHIQLLSWEFRCFLRLINVPWIVSLRGSDIAIKPLISLKEKEFVTEVLAEANAIHCVSESLRQEAIKLGATHEKVIVIRRTPQQVTIERNVSFDDEVIQLTLCGRYHWTKGIPYALQAVRKILDQKKNVNLHLVGDGNEDQMGEVCYWISNLKLDLHVQRHGRVRAAQINSILSSTHIYLQPSLSEGIPNTLTQAIQSGIPVVASRAGGINEVVSARHGILVSPGDAEELANAIMEVIENRGVPLRNLENGVEMEVNEVEEYKNLYLGVLKQFETQVPGEISHS